MSTFNKHRHIGKKYNNLTIIDAYRDKGSSFVDCICDCGNSTTTRLDHLKSGNTKSCGCLHEIYLEAANVTHGLSNHKLYSVYGDMVARCHDTKHSQFRYYGAKGVTVCEEWRDSFIDFYLWSLANGYKEGLELDKDEMCNKLHIKPKTYSPRTCQWVTRSYNANIKRG